MKWTNLGWDAEPWARGTPYDKWRRVATTEMIEKYASKRWQNEQTAPKRVEKVVAKPVAKGAAVFGDLFK